MQKRIYDLDDRLNDLAVLIITITEALPKTIAGNYLANQLLRSGASPALQYGEAHAAESRNDFIHKMKIPLKELRETLNCLKIINKLKWKSSDCELVLNEVPQLIAIFTKSIKTAQLNNIPMSGKEKHPKPSD